MPQSLAAKLKSETRFLLEEVCGPSLPSGLRTADASAILAEARQQQVRGLLDRWAQARPGGAPLEPLAGLRSSTAQHTLRLVAETARLAATFAQAGVPLLVLKGATLSQRYYGDYGARETGDIDLLVSPADAVRADRLLRDLGCRRTKPRVELSPARLGLYLQTQHEFGYLDRHGEICVELHWRYADCAALQPAGFAELLERSEALRIGATDVRMLCPADTFLQLAIHGALDGWWRLKWIADLPRVRAGIADGEMARITDDAARAGLQRALALAQALGGEPVAPAPWLDTALEYVAWRLQNPHPRELPVAARLRHAYASRRFLHALFEQDLLRQMGFADLIMPADFDHVTLPDALTPALPYVARVHRGVRRLFGTAR